MTTKQIRGRFNDGNGGRCVLGAALDAINITPTTHWFGEECNNAFNIIYKEFPIIKMWSSYAEMENLFVEHPFYSGSVWYLNDHSPMTREELVDCIERFENYISNGNKHPQINTKIKETV